MTYCTDHAVLRYLQRYRGIDIRPVRRHLGVKWGRKPTEKEVLNVVASVTGRKVNELRSMVLTERLIEAMRAGRSRYHEGGCTFVIKQDKVITVLGSRSKGRIAA